MFGVTVEFVTREARENATIREHTLYAHHFIDGSPALTPLGQADLDVLVSHYTLHPGTLCIHRAEASPDLYEARLNTVTVELRKAGIPPSRVTISDGLPGGDGLSSSTVLTILPQLRDAGGEATATSTSDRIPQRQRAPE